LEAKSKEQTGEIDSPEAKQKFRSQLKDDIAAFLQRGGKVQLIGEDVRADLPKKPNSDYGSGPI